MHVKNQISVADISNLIWNQ